MSLNSLPLQIDITNPQRNGRGVSFTSPGRYGAGQIVVRSEGPSIPLRCVRPGSGRPWDDVDIEDARAAGGVTLALGEFDKAPTSGAWPLAFDGDDTGTDALAFDVSAATLKTALDANPAIISAGGISSIVKTGRNYRITFTDTGAQPDFTSSSNTLLPLSSVTITKARVGDASNQEIVVITVKRRPYALCNSWTAAPAASVSIDTIIEGDTSPATNDVQVITLTPGTYDGTYSVQAIWPNVVTAAGAGTTQADIVLAATDTADDITTKLLQHPEATNGDDTVNFKVTGNVGGPFTVEFINELKARDIAEMVATDINLLAPKTITGTLSLDQDAIAQAFDAISETAQFITLIAELTITFPGEEPDVPYQENWTIRRSVLDSDSGALPPSSTYPLPGLVVQYRRDITSYALLAAVPTAGGSVQCLIANITGAPRLFELVAGTDATNTAAGIQRPDDYDGSTNAFVWKSFL